MTDILKEWNEEQNEQEQSSGNFLSQVQGFTPVIDVLAQELGLMSAVVYGIVWRYCQMGDRICKASAATIAKRAQIGTKTVRRHLRKLCGAGYLEDLTPGRRYKPHVYTDTGNAKITGLVVAKTKSADNDSETQFS